MRMMARTVRMMRAARTVAENKKHTNNEYDENKNEHKNKNKNKNGSSFRESV